MLKWIKKSNSQFAKFIRQAGEDYKKSQKVDYKKWKPIK